MKTELESFQDQTQNTDNFLFLLRYAFTQLILNGRW